jgi:ELWxxDGT repeat protein
MLAFASTAFGAAPAMVRDIAPGSAGSRPIRLAEVGGKLFFSAPGAAAFRAPWVSDGTELGTVSLGQTCDNFVFSKADTAPRDYTNVNGTAFFSCFFDGALWKSNGTPAGTVLVQDGLDALQEFTARKGELFFISSLDACCDSWPLRKTNGTSVALVKDGLIAGDLINVAGTLFFTDAQNPLWKSDGTPAGTSLVRRWPDSAFGSTVVFPEAAVGKTLFFIVDRVDKYGIELWKSDGTKAGTVLVKDIRPGPGSSKPLNLTAKGGTVYFSANDGVHGRELWKSDGTRSGTVLVKDIHPGPRGSAPRQSTASNGRLFFSAADGRHGRELWRSNGWSGGTALVRNIRPGIKGSSPSQLTNVKGTLAFAAGDGTHGRELWTTDGSRLGTRLIEIAIAPFGSSAPRDLTNVAGTLFFSARDGIHGRELWSVVP